MDQPTPIPPPPMYARVYDRLLVRRNSRTLVAGFRTKLERHFDRLPPSYALDVNPDEAESILAHIDLLDEAEAQLEGQRPVFSLNFKKRLRPELPVADDPMLLDLIKRPRLLYSWERFWETSPTSAPLSELSAVVDATRRHVELSGFNTDLMKKILESEDDKTLDPGLRSQISDCYVEWNQWRKRPDENEDDKTLIGTLFARLKGSSVPVHEVLFSSIDRPKLLSKLSHLLTEIGLHINESHSFSTSDGYTLDVFSVDGWPIEDTDDLRKEIKDAITRYDPLWTVDGEEILAWQIEPELLTMGERISTTALGDLYHGTYFEKDVSVRVLRFPDVSQKTNFIAEATLLWLCQHANVVRFVGAGMTYEEIYHVTEYLPEGRLYDFLHTDTQPLAIGMLLKFALDICKGMHYLHENNIIHGDLKTSNLLMDKNHVIKVGNFQAFRPRSKFSLGATEERTRTYRWMAPELLKGRGISRESDVYSFGVVLWELQTSKIPFDNLTPHDAADKVRKGHRPELPANADPRLSHLIQRCWDQEPAYRPTFNTITAEIEELLRQVQVEAAGENREQ